MRNGRNIASDSTKYKFPRIAIVIALSMHVLLVIGTFYSSGLLFAKVRDAMGGLGMCVEPHTESDTCTNVSGS